MSDRDLLEIFDAALPRLTCFGPGTVPAAGSKELMAYEASRQNDREMFGMFSLLTASLGALSWLFWGSWMPIWIMMILVALPGSTGLVAARAFLKLAFARPAEHALPPGTDKVTARLEDGTWNLIRYWNYDVFIWHQRVDALRLEVSGWQVLRDVPEARDIEWTEKGSMTQAEGLIAAIQGLASDRAALVARREEIEHRLLSMQVRMRRLKASEEAFPLLPAPATDDPSEK